MEITMWFLECTMGILGKQNLAKRSQECPSVLAALDKQQKRNGRAQSSYECEVAQSCLTLCNPMDTRLLCPWAFLGTSTGVGCLFLLQGTSRPRDRTQVFCIVDRRFTVWATREVKSRLNSYQISNSKNNNNNNNIKQTLDFVQGSLLAFHTYQMTKREKHSLFTTTPTPLAPAHTSSGNL